MRKYLKIVSPLVFLISLILIYSLRTLPKGQLWKSYSVIYVDKNAENQRVMQIFDNMQIKNVVSLNSQFLPVVISENSVEYAMLRLNYSNPDHVITDTLVPTFRIAGSSQPKSAKNGLTLGMSKRPAKNLKTTLI